MKVTIMKVKTVASPAINDHQGGTALVIVGLPEEMVVNETKLVLMQSMRSHALCASYVSRSTLEPGHTCCPKCGIFV